MEVGSSNSYQTIALAAYDQAGNISRKAYDPEHHRQAEASYSVLVTADSFVQFVNNRPLLGAVALSAAAAAFLAAMAAGKWRKKGNSSAGGRTLLKKQGKKFPLDSHANKTYNNPCVHKTGSYFLCAFDKEK